MENRPTAMRVPETAYMMKRLLMKSTFTLAKMSLFQLCQKLRDLPLSNLRSMMRRVMKMAVKSDVRIPMPSVVAKPFTGPPPKKYRMMAMTKDVMLESKIADSACL
jgi:hypothetical protein